MTLPHVSHATLVPRDPGWHQQAWPVPSDPRGSWWGHLSPVEGIWAQDRPFAGPTLPPACGRQYCSWSSARLVGADEGTGLRAPRASPRSHECHARPGRQRVWLQSPLFIRPHGPGSQGANGAAGLLPTPTTPWGLAGPHPGKPGGRRGGPWFSAAPQILWEVPNVRLKPEVWCGRDQRLWPVEPRGRRTGTRTGWVPGPQVPGRSLTQ